ncbi:hypothetical protein Bbelb_230230 [Branchiostoma belcheri]|nr:hypothetical protein Bbelb_230230 [Branchiostoma belcheri]
METTVNTTELVEYITDSLYARTTTDNLTLTQTMMPDMNGNTTDVPPTNTSFPDPPTFPMSYQVITTVLVLVICSIGIVGNIMVVLVVTRIKSMRSPTNCYLVSLAVADLIVLVTAGIPNIPDSFYYESAWMYGHSGCLIITYLQYLGINTSSMSILAFTVERYIAICHPLYAQTMCTVSRAKKIIAGVWVLTLAYDSMWFFLMGTETIVYGNGAEVLQCGYNMERNRYLTVYFLDLSLFYLLPLIVAAVLYVRIGRVLYSEDIAEAGNIEIANKGQTHVKHMQARRINSRKQPGRAPVWKCGLSITQALFWIRTDYPEPCLNMVLDKTWLWIRVDYPEPCLNMVLDKTWLWIRVDYPEPCLNMVLDKAWLWIRVDYPEPCLNMVLDKTWLWIRVDYPEPCLNMVLDKAWLWIRVDYPEPCLNMVLDIQYMVLEALNGFTWLSHAEVRSDYAGVMTSGRLLKEALSTGPLQVVKMLACVVVLFAVLWMPYRVLVVCNSFIDPPNYDKWVVLFCRLPIYINSACNPVLYNAMSVKFRRAFSKLAKCTSKRDDLNSMNFQSSIRAVTRSNRV